MDRIARDFVLAVISILVFSGASLAATPKECQPLTLQTYSWVTEGKPAAVQVAFNETKGDKGQFALADGHLKSYNPADVPELEKILQRGQTGAFQKLSKATMVGFNFVDAGKRKLSIERVDSIFLVILRDGEVVGAQDKTALSVNNLQCFTGSFYDPGYYMTGFVQDGDSTALVSFAVRNVTFQSK